MQHILEILATPFRHFQPATVLRGSVEPLDHPCLITAPHGVLDDLPLPAYAVDRDGRVRLVGET
jgi:hypothetical protein